MAKRAHNQENPSESMVKTKRPHLASTSTAEEIDSVAAGVAGMENTSDSICKKTKMPGLCFTAESDKDKVIEMTKSEKNQAAHNKAFKMHAHNKAFKMQGNHSKRCCHCSTKETDMELEIARLRNRIAAKDDNAEIRRLQNILAQKNRCIGQIIEVFGEITELQNIRLKIRKLFDKSLSNIVGRAN